MKNWLDFTAGVIYSDDYGDTWQAGQNVPPGVGTNECQAVELVDGTLMLNQRNYYYWPRSEPCRMISVSGDGGQTWTEIAADYNLPEIPCSASIMRFTKRSDGFVKNRLLFCNPANTGDWGKLTVRISYDEGTTWTVSRQLTSAGAYSCLTVMQDMTIGVIYEGDGAISFRRFNLEWLSSGTDVLRKRADLNNDDIINLEDFDIVVDGWLESEIWP